MISKAFNHGGMTMEESYDMENETCIGKAKSLTCILLMDGFPLHHYHLMVLLSNMVFSIG
jgi:hypothetical protein